MEKKAGSRANRFRFKRLAVALIAAGASVVVPGTSAFAATTGTTASRNDTATVTLLDGQVVPLDPTKRTKAQETAYRDQVTLLDAQGRLTPSMMD